MTDLASLQDFVEGYEICPLPSDEPPTLMQIAGVQYREAVYSNILAFLIESDEVHGFGPLFIQSIMAAYGDALRKVGRHAEMPDPARFVDATVETEIRTNSGRIDILIESAGFAICIENKIWARLNNDLAEYRKYCEDTRDGDFLGIVLSPSPIPTDEIARLEHAEGLKGKDLKFVSITYSDVVAEVRERMDDSLRPHDSRHHYLLFDFLEQADRLERNIMITDEQESFLENIWRKNEGKIGNIVRLHEGIQDFAQKVTKEHRRACDDSLTGDRVIVSGIAKKDVTAYFELVDEGEIDGCRVFLDVWFDPLHGIQHQIGDRHHDRGSPDLPELVKRIEKQSGIEFEDAESEDTESSVGRFLLKTENLSPFDQSDRDKAVETSVTILKVIAKLRREREESSEKHG